MPQSNESSELRHRPPRRRATAFRAIRSGCSIRGHLHERFRRDESGSASLEFLTAGTLLLAPMVYLVLAVSSLQSTAFAVEGAARHAARVFIDAETTTDAAARAERAIAVALTDAGLDPGAATVEISCSPRPTECLTPDGLVTVTVTAPAALPLAPAALSVDAPLAVPMAAAATQRVPWFGGLQ